MEKKEWISWFTIFIFFVLMGGPIIGIVASMGLAYIITHKNKGSGQNKTEFRKVIGTNKGLMMSILWVLFCITII